MTSTTSHSPARVLGYAWRVFVWTLLTFPIIVIALLALPFVKLYDATIMLRSKRRTKRYMRQIESENYTYRQVYDFYREYLKTEQCRLDRAIIRLLAWHSNREPHL